MQDYLVSILEIINSNKTDIEMKEALLEYHANDIATIFSELSLNERKKLYRVLDEETLSDIFSYLDDASTFFSEMDKEMAADIIEEMDSDDAVDVLEDLDKDYQEEILGLLEEDALEDINLIRSYNDDELGSLITTNFITIHRSDSVKVAMNEVIKQAAENDNVTIIYVLDDSDKYYGTIDLRDMFIARADSNLDDYIKKTYPKFYDHEAISDTYNALKEYSLESYPILDNNERLIGVITSSDLVELTDDTLSDDYAKLAGLSSEIEAKTSIMKSVGKRLPWLLILLVLGMLISMLISSFEGVVAELPIVVFFQSLVLGMSGNVGTQSLAVTIRTLNDGDVTGKKLAKVVFKEVRVGFINGLLLAICAFVIVGLFISITKLTISVNLDFSYQRAFMISGIISIALIISMTLASFVGAIVPIFFKKIHVDPAVASGPFITTINDIVAVLVYYGLAWLLIWVVL